jgi:cytochrome c oxidase assembly protein subunit 15
MFQRLSSFQRLALWTTAITYVLILVGGLVRASGAGLGCPDWPRCFGGWIPPMSAADLPPQFDASQFNPTLMWTEYLNRVLGMAVGLFILATVISAWRHHRHEPRILWTSIAALLLTGFQGWLGGRVVAHELAAWIVTIHMIVALVIVQMLLYVTVQTMPRGGQTPRRSLLGVRPLVVLLIAITLIQIGLGTQVRGGVDAALDAGTARDSALATIGWLDYLHRDIAIVVLFGAVWLAAKIRSPWSYAVLGLAAAQILLGVVMAYVSLLPAAQVLHLTLASLLLGAETVLFLTGSETS